MKKHFILKKVFLFIQIFFCVHSYSQECNYSFYGEIFDLHLNDNLSDAKIELEGKEIEVFSNEIGEFVIENLCRGEYSIIISHPNCKTINAKISIPRKEVKKFYLEHHLTELEEIIVMGESIVSEGISSIESLMTSEEALRYKSKSLGDAIEQLSGVSSYKTGNSIVKPVLHGLTGSRIGIINNGIRLQDNEWGVDHAPSIDLSSIESIQLIKGAGTLKYAGDAIGGIIKINYDKNFVEDSLYGYNSLGYNDNGKGIYFISKIVRSSNNGNNYGASISLKSNGDHNSKNYNLSNSGARKIAGSIFFSKNKITKEWGARYSFFRNELGILMSSHVGNLGDLARAINSQIPLDIRPFTRKINSPHQLVSHHNFSAFIKNKNHERKRWDLNYSYQSNHREEFDLRRGEYRNQAGLNIHLQTHDIVFDMILTNKNRFAWKYGASFQFQDNFSNPNTGLKRLIPDHQKIKSGLYGISEFNYSDSFRIEAGVRFDIDYITAKKYYNIDRWNELGYDDDYKSTILLETSIGNYLTEQIKSFKNLSSTFGIKKKIKDNINAILNIAYTSRSPNAAELFSDGLHHSMATIELGSLRLVPEKAFKLIFSFENKKGPVSYSLTGFNSIIKNYINLEPSYDGFEKTARGAFLKRQYRQIPSVNMRGLDFDIKLEISNKINLKSSASMIEAFEDGKTPLVDIPPFNLKNELIFELSQKTPLIMRIKSEYVGKQKNFPNQNFDYDYLINGAINQMEVDISETPRDYHLLGLDVEKQFYEKINARIYIDNILNLEYRSYLNRLRYFAPEIGRLIGIELNYKF